MYLVMMELLRQPTLELTHALGELIYVLGDAAAAVAPNIGAAMHSQGGGAVCALGDDRVAVASHVCTPGAVCVLGNDGAALVPHTGADAHAWGADVRAW